MAKPCKKNEQHMGSKRSAHFENKAEIFTT